jgi:hypothetical protein
MGNQCLNMLRSDAFVTQSLIELSTKISLLTDAVPTLIHICGVMALIQSQLGLGNPFYIAQKKALCIQM